jgi:hypothetical protein
MAIDVSQETILPLGAVPHRFPHLGRRTPDGKRGRIHFSTVFRWFSRGVVGPDGERVRLEGVKLGGKLVTSLEAIQRFNEALTPRVQGEPKQLPPPRSSTRRLRAAERAEQELERAGI